MSEVELEWYVVKYDAENKIKTHLWLNSAWDNNHYNRLCLIDKVVRNEDVGYSVVRVRAHCSRAAKLIGGMLIYNAIYKVARHLYDTIIEVNGDITTKLLVKYPREFYKIDEVVICSTPDYVAIQTYASDAEEAEVKAIAEVVKRLQPCTSLK